ncbi:LysE family translocator [Stutzerimonas nitrititolerans]|uniref:LysE family translocator n=1 Tax=Stutzerimonas nitrititolerans TaxID=2482751 RepID=UPI00026D7B11|nr:LysE family translocator [Stutzerimonas nitrititolerans]AFN77579.1 LysE family transporter [Stutzerimonas stutzeri DSM 10701]KRW64819.1 lysine transporter LysE [Pseudomonas sp. TTU2014-066ASC]MBA1234474.1 LysE family translocator [Stutzerimonas stutzeri]OCX17141.1 lysine transporter LysE [Stutzerimonas xanthomarina]HBB77862.1 LysE family translocator [Pseudomonas sp.]
MQSLLPFLIFAFVASITPGPTNILVLGHGARFGLRATLPLVLGASLAAALIVLLVGLGLGEALQRYPRVQQAMSLLGALWLSWLAWQLLRSAAQSFEAASATHRELGPLGAALLQLVNPKVWMMAVAVVSVFAAGSADKAVRVAQLSLVFLLMTLPCMSAWALLGAGSARLLQSPQRVRRFNQLLAILLLASTWLALLL